LSRGRYPFKTYVRLALVVALLAVVNTLFTNLVQNVVGNFNIVFDTVIALGMIGYAFVFALIFWRFDSNGSIGRLLGAKTAEDR
jgi:nucleoside permease NupC